MQCAMQLKHTFTEPDSVSTEVSLKGTLYKKGSFLCLKRESDESIKFGQIGLVLIDDKKVCFLVTLFSVFIRVWTL